MSSSPSILRALFETIKNPCLAKARDLENELRKTKHKSRLLGRRNQKSSIDAAAESDRGITERLANSFDASLTAARILADINRSDAALTPRIAAQRFFKADENNCVWDPQYPAIKFQKPILQFWSEDPKEKLRFRQYQSREGLVTALVQDASLGIERQKMADTILSLNSDDKLVLFEAIGQFGHGGSSALAFCELCLVITKPRFGANSDDFSWTLIYPEREGEASKQSIVRKWFCLQDELPLSDKVDSLKNLDVLLPGTSIWHFGYIRGSWLRQTGGTHQDTPSSRLARLFFSYPLPFEIYGEFARGDSPTGTRTVKGAFYRLIDDRTSGDSIVEYRSGEKSESLRLEGVNYGTISVFIFVLKDRDKVRSYVDKNHPIIITFNGQNHGEMTSNIITLANFPELAGSSIVEVRLDALNEEALSNIISNSREQPKHTPFTEVLRDRVRDIIASDETLIELEKRRQEEKAKRSSDDLNQKITRFLSAILSDATAGPADRSGGKSLGGGGKRPTKTRPEIPAKDPPQLLKFLSESCQYIPFGTTRILKFMSDARPPKYSFHGDNPRCFAHLETVGSDSSNLEITGKADVDGRGYGSISITSAENPEMTINEEQKIGSLSVSIQTTDGRTLTATIEVGIGPKPEARERKRRPSVKPQIVFCAPSNADRTELARLLAEDEKNIGPFGSFLEKYRDALSVDDANCTYWGEASEKDGESLLSIEINVAHPRMLSLLKSCTTAEEVQANH